LSAPFKFGLQFLSKNCDKKLKQATVTIFYGNADSLMYTFHVKCIAKTSGVENMTEPGEYYWIVPDYAGLPAFNDSITVVAGGGDGAGDSPCNLGSVPVMICRERFETVPYGHFIQVVCTG
jgi:hypothetical protein